MGWAVSWAVSEAGRAGWAAMGGGGGAPGGAALAGQVSGALLLAGQRHAVVPLVRPELPGGGGGAAR